MASTAAQKRASKKYQAANYRRIPLDVRFFEFDIIKDAATKAGESVNGYIKKAVFDRIEHEIIIGLDESKE